MKIHPTNVLDTGAGSPMTADRVRSVQERRRSGASGKHADRRTRRNRTRTATKARAIKEQA